MDLSVQQVFDVAWTSGSTEFQAFIRWIAIFVAAAGFALHVFMKTRGRNSGMGGYGGTGGVAQFAQRLSLPVSIFLALFALAPETILGVLGKAIDLILLFLVGLFTAVANIVTGQAF